MPNPFLTRSQVARDFQVHETVVTSPRTQRGDGLVLKTGWATTRLGNLLMALGPHGLCWLGFAVGKDKQETVRRLHAFFPRATFQDDPHVLAPFAKRIDQAWQSRPFRMGEAPVPLDLYGAAFELSVWRALLSIPYGEVVSYGDIARSIGTPRAARAVGSAVGDNPVSLLIPCHRVVLSDGKIGHYGWGTPLKRTLLGLEQDKAS